MTEKLTHKQINEQMTSSYLNNTDADPTVLVKRSDGRVTVGRLDTDNRDVHFTEDDQELVKPQVSMEALSDQQQAKLAQELAGVALRGNEISVADKDSAASLQETEPESLEKAELDASIDQLKSEMSDSDQVPAWRYAVAIDDHELHRAWRQLSSMGRLQAIRYRDLIEQRNKL